MKDKGLSDNGRTAIGYICIALCLISWFLMIAWMASPSEFTFRVEMDNNTLNAVESIEWDKLNQEKSIDQKPCWDYDNYGQFVVNGVPKGNGEFGKVYGFNEKETKSELEKCVLQEKSA